MLAIEVELLTGRYAATHYADRSRGEWPPPPARLYSALVATLHASGNAPDARAALEWLEQQPPPALTASPAHPRTVSTHFVPVNDPFVGAHSTLNKQQAKLDEALALVAQATTSKARTKAQAKVTKAQAKLEATSRAEAAAPFKVTKDLATVMPASRTKQPRTFPVMVPEHPVVVFQWPEAAPPAALRAQLCGLVAQVCRLGHSSSLVRCAVVTEPPAPTLVPSPDGDQALRVVRPGQLAQLEAAFSRHQGVRPRVMPKRMQAYAPVAAQEHEPVVASTLSRDWLLFQLRGDRLPLPATAGLARLFRSALLQALTQDGATLSPALSGHDGSGRPATGAHLAVLPLPFVGHRYADGDLKGVALALPPDLSADDHRLLLRAVGRLEQRFAPHPEPGAPPALELRFRNGVVCTLERLLDAPRLYSLRPRTWQGPARCWATATPIALDRHPGRLRARGTAKAWAQAHATVVESCRRIGLPEPSRVELSLSPTLRGSVKTAAFPAFPISASKGPRRMLVHARLTFPTRVRGPVALGAGRHLGLGLCRPTFDAEEGP